MVFNMCEPQHKYYIVNWTKSIEKAVYNNWVKD